MGAGIPLIQDQDRLEAVWAQVLERLRGLLNGATYSLTFERARALGFDGGRFRIGVETEFARYPDSAHLFPWTGNPAYRVDVLGRVIDWFDRHL